MKATERTSHSRSISIMRARTQHTLDEFGVKDMIMRSVLVDRLIAARCTADQCERTEKGFLECLTDEARKELLEEINRYDENCNERKAG